MAQQSHTDAEDSVDRQRIAATRIRECIDEELVDGLIGIEDLHVFSSTYGDIISVNMESSADDGHIVVLGRQKATLISHIMRSHAPVKVYDIMSGKGQISFKPTLDAAE